MDGSLHTMGANKERFREAVSFISKISQIALWMALFPSLSPIASSLKMKKNNK